jgi:hypothetical protein
MVDYSGMFRADPRIKRGRRFADTFTQGSLKPIAPPPGTNVYGFSPWGEAAQRLALALGGRMASSSADQREAEQRAARTQVMAHLLKAGSARTGQLTQTQVPLPGPDYARTRTQYSVADDGSQRAIEPLPAGVFEKAGGIAGGYQIALADARARRDTLTQARLERDIKNRLGEVGAKLANDRNNPELFAEVQQLRSLLDPAGFATEAATEQMVRGAEKRKDARTQEAEIRVVNQQIERRKRELGYKLDAEGRKALAWTVQQDYSRANRNIDEIEREKRAVTRAIAEEKRRLGRDLSQEERSNLEYIARQELHLGVTIDAERRAELIIVNRENRARTRLIATEKRAVDRAIQVREADLRRTLTAEERAETTYKARAEFDGQRDEIKALAAAKRKRIDVWRRDSGAKDFITQEMMDADQAGKSPQYSYDDSKKDGKVSFVHFVPTETFSAGGRTYLESVPYQVTQRSIIEDAELRNSVETQTRVIRSSEYTATAPPQPERIDPNIPSGERMLKIIRDASARDLPGIAKTSVDAVMAFFTLEDVFPDTREAKASFNEMRMTMRVPLVKALSDRGGKFTIEQANSILPGSNLSDAENMARIKALISTYNQTRFDAEAIKETQKTGSNYFVAASKVIATINGLMPELNSMVKAWDERNLAPDIPPRTPAAVNAGVPLKEWEVMSEEDRALY